MTGKKLNQLFQAARQDAAPEPPAGFADDVVRAIRREPPPARPGELALFDQLNAMFPRMALAALAVMVLGIAANLALGAPNLADWSDSDAQISAQWFLSPDGD